MSTKMTFETGDFMKDLQKQLNDLGADIKKVTETALIRSQEILNSEAEEAMQDRYLPAKGRYSTESTLKSLYKDKKVAWSGDTASIDAGFSIRAGGIASIFLLYGTPRMKKDQKLYDAFFSKKAVEERTEAQEKVFLEEIQKIQKG